METANATSSTAAMIPYLMKAQDEVVDLRTLLNDLVTSTATAVRSGGGRGTSSSSSWNFGADDDHADVVRMVVFGSSAGDNGSGGDVEQLAGVPAQVDDPMTDKEEEDRELFLFITYGILLTAIGLLGLAGNALSIVVLSRPQMRSSINCCLIGLASFDMVVLVTSMLMFGVFHLCTFTDTFPFYERTLYPLLVPLALYPFGLIAQTGSVWVTVIVTVERYIAVCHPLHAKSICTYSRARGYIVIISLLSVVYNLPRFWEVSRDQVFVEATNETVYVLQPSWLRQNRTYVTIYITWIYLFFIYFVPFVLLAVLNGFIWMQVRRANRERQQLSRLQKKEMGLAIMLFCVVVVFFICNVMALVVNVLETVGIIVDQLTVAANLLITINSSVNFSIYCIFGQKFRKILLKTVCSRCLRVVFFRTRRHAIAADLDESFCPVSTTMAETRTLLLNNNGNNGSVHVNQCHLVTKMQPPDSSSTTSAKANRMSMTILSSNCDNSTRVNNQAGSRLSRTTSLSLKSGLQLTST